ncbi:MAG: DHH family phosphoesterase [Schwartzia sp.]|nr:DHH family phosphoesterase [Schwartzia sp. (in: firmicutes)]
MLKKTSAWPDVCIMLAACGILAAALFSFDRYFGGGAVVLVLCLAFLVRERQLKRERDLEEYFRDVVSYIKPVMNYAVDRMPVAILMVNEEGRLLWSNAELSAKLSPAPHPEFGTPVKDFWPEMILKPIWGMTGEYIFRDKEISYRAEYRPVPLKDGSVLMAFYVTDVTELEQMRAELAAAQTVLAYIQIDNYDEALQSLVEAERSTLSSTITNMLDAWAKELGFLIQRLNEEKYVAVMERRALDLAIESKFDILDRVHSLQGSNKLPITLSFGVVAVEQQTVHDAARQALKTLELALARGGDQAAVSIEGKTQFFGGKSPAVEKYTRVKVRVVAHSLREQIEGSDEAFIMGHKNEDFDALGAAMGVAQMVRFSKKPVHILLSDLNEGIDKFTERMADKPEYTSLFIHESALETMMPSPKALLVIVDTHIPKMVASSRLLAAVSRKIIIDHHRRSEDMIETPQLSYIEPSSSSTSEMVSELTIYYADDLKLTRFDATALYAGIVVDTKHFGVQTGVRTLEAAAYLRKAGADPVMVRQLFREDYETNLTMAKAMAASTMYDGGLIVATCREPQPNIQAIAAQIADGLLLIEKVRMSIVVFQLTPDIVGISARAVGELNVQVIMEEFGGGGHQNVAGAQIKNGNLDEIEAKAVEVARKYIEENG